MPIPQTPFLTREFMTANGINPLEGLRDRALVLAITKQLNALGYIKWTMRRNGRVSDYWIKESEKPGIPKITLPPDAFDPPTTE